MNPITPQRRRVLADHFEQKLNVGTRHDPPPHPTPAREPIDVDVASALAPLVHAFEARFDAASARIAELGCWDRLTIAIDNARAALKRIAAHRAARTAPDYVYLDEPATLTDEEPTP